jgi:hypothetical protein
VYEMFEKLIIIKKINIDMNKTILLSLFVHNLAPISHRLAVNDTRCFPYTHDVFVV